MVLSTKVFGKNLIQFGVLSPTSEYMYPSFFGFSLKYIPITKTCGSPLLNQFCTFSSTKGIFHRKNNSGRSWYQSPKVTLLLEREGDEKGRHDSQYCCILNSKRRVKSCIKHGWCSPYLGTGYIGSVQGGKSILSTCINILRLDPGRREQFLYDPWFWWKIDHIRISLPPTAIPCFFCTVGSAWMSCLTNKIHGHIVNEGSCIAFTPFSCLECWTIWSSKSPKDFHFHFISD